MRGILKFYLLFELSLIIDATDQTCRPNEVVDLCVSPCPKTCQRPNPPICEFVVCNKGCSCATGFIRDEISGRCVPPGSCPNDIVVQTCPPHEELDLCISPCQPTCQRPSPPICEFLGCNKGCKCVEGYLRDEISGRCVPAEFCTNGCGPNQVWHPCGPASIETCQRPISATTDLTRCFPRCVCIGGLVWDEVSEQCISKCECRTLCRKQNEEYTCCGPVCPLSCQKQCAVGCFCKEGYVRNQLDGKCVKPEECPVEYKN